MKQQLPPQENGHIDPLPQITRREFHGLLTAFGVAFCLPQVGAVQETPGFVHPGLLHSAADLERIEQAVQNHLSPVAEGFSKLREHPLSQLSYVHHTFSSEIGRNPSVNFPAFDQDANAAYQCALMYCILGDKRYADLSCSILRGWANSLESVSGADAVLMAGLAPFKFINAAELMRADGSLDSASVAACQKMLRRAILPTLMDFAPFANGNWDTAAIKTMMAAAVFCEDRALFERAVLYYLNGDGDGRLDHYIYANGQCQESGRDQQHTQLGLAHMADACEIAWHQGIDLYSALDNRLLKGFEYTAAYILGDAVEVHPDQDRTGKYVHTAISARSALRPVFELVLAHYHGRRGLPAPAVTRAAQAVRPEGAGPGADQTGFGTLLYAGMALTSHDAVTLAPPTALHAEADHTGIHLSWAAVKNAHGYSIERAGQDGRFTQLASKLTQESFLDRSAAAGKLYSYRVTAQSSAVTSAPSISVRIQAGLPGPWREVSLGHPHVPGSAQYDGSVLRLYAAGAGLLMPRDEGHSMDAASSHTRLQARFLPQVASQSAVFGLMHRQDASPLSPGVALLLAPEAGDIERHGWSLRMMARSADGSVQTIATHALTDPVVQYGRLMRPVWFRLEVRLNHLQASYSLDGSAWILLGESPLVGAGNFALVAASGIAGIDTEVRFDSILLA